MENPFRIKKQADDMEPTEIASLFGEPPGYEKFLQPSHHFLIGGRGSGKTTLLRAVCSSIISKRKHEHNVPFYGLYLPLKRFEIDHFVHSYEYTGSTEPFWLFFSSELYLNLIEQGADSLSYNKLSDKIENIVRTTLIPNSTYLNASVMIRLKKIRAKAMEAVHKYPHDSPNHLDDFNISQVALLSALEQTAQAFKDSEIPKLAILVDGYDYIGSLADDFSWLFQREYLPLFCIKCATRCMPWSGKGEPIGAIPDERSIKMFCLDQNPESHQYFDLLTKIINNAFKSAGYDRIDPHKLLPSGGSRYLYSGFETIAALSSGNTLNFLEICENAWDEAFKNRDPKLPNQIMPKFQNISALNRSRKWFNLDLSDHIGDEFREFRSFVYWSGSAAKLSQSDNYIGGAFKIEKPISPSVKQVFRKAVMQRHLLCSSDDFLRTNIGGGDPPNHFSLSRMYAPRLDLPVWNAGELELESNEIEHWMKKPIQSPHDPERPKLGAKAKLNTNYLYEKDLFASNGMDEDTSKNDKLEIMPVFISHSINVPDQERQRQTKRLQNLKTAIINIRKADISSRPRLSGLNDVEFCIAAKDLWKANVENFRHDIPVKIQNACYIVHDVTFYSTGVAFEIGLAWGFKKPFFLFWNINDKPLQADILHKAIRGQNIKQFPPQERTSFKNWYRTAIDSFGLKYHGNTKCSTIFGNECSFNEQKGVKPFAFISFQARNNDVKECLIKVLDEFNIKNVENYLDSGLDDNHKLCLSIRNSNICFIDVSEGLPDFAFEAGIAQATGKICMLLYDESWRGGEDPCIMASSPKYRFIHNNLSRLKDNISSFLRSSKLGGRRRE